MHLILVVFIFFALIVSAGVIVGGWLLVSLTRGLRRLVFGRPSTRPAATPAIVSPASAICNRHDCGAANPAHAQFCRRCGDPLAGRPGAAPLRVA